MMIVAGCGGSGSGDDTPDAAAAASPLATASATPGAAAGAPKVKAGGKTSTPSVAPEQVAAPSTTDAKSQEILVGDWPTQVVAALRKVDPRLVADQPSAVKKVRATCKQMETGMFSTKVIPIIEKRFSSKSITVSADLAQQLYTVLLQDACYSMKN